MIRRRQNRGVALITALLIMALVTTLTYSLEWDNSLDLRRTIVMLNRDQAVQVALGRLLKSWGLAPAVVLGVGVGEYAAACVAGVFSLADGCKLLAARGSNSGAKAVGGLSFSFPRTPLISCALGAVAAKGTVDAGKYWLDEAAIDRGSANLPAAYAALAAKVRCPRLQPRPPAP